MFLFIHFAWRKAYCWYTMLINLDEWWPIRRRLTWDTSMDLSYPFRRKTWNLCQNGQIGANMWMKTRALDYKECGRRGFNEQVGDDFFADDEVWNPARPWFSPGSYTVAGASRRVNARWWKRWKDAGHEGNAFDVKRWYTGFTVLVDV